MKQWKLLLVAMAIGKKGSEFTLFLLHLKFLGLHEIFQDCPFFNLVLCSFCIPLQFPFLNIGSAGLDCVLTKQWVETDDDDDDDPSANTPAS